jgi:hypothetical protein
MVSKLIIAACVAHNMCVLCDDDVQQYIEHDGPIHPNNYPSVSEWIPWGVASHAADEHHGLRLHMERFFYVGS